VRDGELSSEHRDTQAYSRSSSGKPSSPLEHGDRHPGARYGECGHQAGQRGADNNDAERLAAVCTFSSAPTGRTLSSQHSVVECGAVCLGAQRIRHALSVRRARVRD
jgi:hypothetical protein